MKASDYEEEEVCASCGIASGDGIKLKKCTACKLVQYCSIACQKDHRVEHKRACKMRAAELREEVLFKQPESSHLGDCPICILPMSLNPRETLFRECCSKVVCMGCAYAYYLEHVGEDEKCPFCRTPESKLTRDHRDHFWNMRIEANDPVAICQMGTQLYEEQKFSSAFELYTKASQLGDVDAHFHLASLFVHGEGVERDEKKVLFHSEEAAIGGHAWARCNLGIIEEERGRMERAVKHYIIASNLGHDKSMDMLKRLYKNGIVKKEDLAAALRAHKDAVDATKSPQREAAVQFCNTSEGWMGGQRGE